MYATTTSSIESFSTQPSPDPDFRKRLGAVYARRVTALRELASQRTRHAADAWDVVQDAFLAVLERPPADTSERGLSAALETAVRAAHGRMARQRADDAALRVALRKRFPV